MPSKEINRGWQGKQTSGFGTFRRQRKPVNPIVDYTDLHLYIDFQNGICFDNTGTTVNDLSKNNNGTLTNGPVFDSRFDGVINFDGTNDYIDYGTTSTLDKHQYPLTIMAWVRPTSTSGNRTIYSMYKSVFNQELISMLRLDSGVMKYYTSTTNGFQNQGTLNIPANIWSFVAVTVSNSSTPVVRLFSNQTNQSFTYSAIGATVANNVPLYIGGVNANNTEFLAGDIGQLLVYKKELTISEVIRFRQQTRSRYGV